MNKLNQSGVAHHFLLVVVVLSVAIFGTYQLVKSRAASLPTNSVATTTAGGPAPSLPSAPQPAGAAPVSYKLVADGPATKRVAINSVYKLTGKAKAGSAVKIFFHFAGQGARNGQLIYDTNRTVTANAQGVWSFDVTARESFRYYATNATERSANIHVVAVEKVSIFGPASRDVAANASVKISGRATNGAPVTLTITPDGGAAQNVSVKANTENNWSYTLKVAKSTTVVATAEGASTAPYRYVVKPTLTNQRPGPTVNKPASPANTQFAFKVNGPATQTIRSGAKLVISGKANASSKVVLRLTPQGKPTQIKNLTANASGNWSYTGNPTQNYTYTVTGNGKTSGTYSVKIKSETAAKPVPATTPKPNTNTGASTAPKPTTNVPCKGSTKQIAQGRANNANCVKEAQRLLGITADGNFGPATKAAVKRFQCTRALSPIDGIVGPATWGKLRSKARATVSCNAQGAPINAGVGAQSGQYDGIGDVNFTPPPTSIRVMANNCSIAGYAPEGKGYYVRLIHDRRNGDKYESVKVSGNILVTLKDYKTKNGLDADFGDGDGSRVKVELRDGNSKIVRSIDRFFIFKNSLC